MRLIIHHLIGVGSLGFWRLIFLHVFILPGKRSLAEEIFDLLLLLESTHSLSGLLFLLVIEEQLPGELRLSQECVRALLTWHAKEDRIAEAIWTLVHEGLHCVTVVGYELLS